MPNHETNNVVIKGSPDNIRRFLSEAFSVPGELDFNLVVPQPEGIEKEGCNGTHAEGVICWYDWNINNWGTKWGAYDHSHYDARYLSNNGVTYGRVDLRFDTAWSAPTPIFEAIEKRWNLTVHALTLDEGGFPDTEYGDPYGEGEMSKTVSVDFDTYDEEVKAPDHE